MKKHNYICTNNGTVLTRCMRKFNAERFIKDLSNRLHAMKDTILAPSNLDSIFSSFISLFLDVLNKHAPLNSYHEEKKNFH